MMRSWSLLGSAAVLWPAACSSSEGTPSDGGTSGLTGKGDERWDDADLATLRTLDLSQLDVGDVSGWKVTDGSNQAKPR